MTEEKPKQSDTPQKTPPVSCSVCGKTSETGYGVGLRKDWATGKWYCLEHRPWITQQVKPE
jgi:hypothetical protein